jgi:hypothetical protein
MTVAVPEVETDQTIKLTAKIAELEARGRALAESAPAAHALAAADPKHNSAYQALCESARSIQIELGEAQRNLRHIREERREKLAREIVASSAYREALLEALVERAECLTSAYALYQVHEEARQRSIPLGVVLFPPLAADVHGLIQWARDLVRIRALQPGDLPKNWLRRELETTR